MLTSNITYGEVLSRIERLPDYEDLWRQNRHTIPSTKLDWSFFCNLLDLALYNNNRKGIHIPREIIDIFVGVDESLFQDLLRLQQNGIKVSVNLFSMTNISDLKSCVAKLKMFECEYLQFRDGYLVSLLSSSYRKYLDLRNKLSELANIPAPCKDQNYRELIHSLNAALMINAGADRDIGLIVNHALQFHLNSRDFLRICNDADIRGFYVSLASLINYMKEIHVDAEKINTLVDLILDTLIDQQENSERFVKMLYLEFKVEQIKAYDKVLASLFAMKELKPFIGRFLAIWPVITDEGGPPPCDYLPSHRLFYLMRDLMLATSAQVRSQNSDLAAEFALGLDTFLSVERTFPIDSYVNEANISFLAERTRILSHGIGDIAACLKELFICYGGEEIIVAPIHYQQFIKKVLMKIETQEHAHQLCKSINWMWSLLKFRENDSEKKVFDRRAQCLENLVHCLLTSERFYSELYILFRSGNLQNSTFKQLIDRHSVLATRMGWFSGSKQFSVEPGDATDAQAAPTEDTHPTAAVKPPTISI